MKDRDNLEPVPVANAVSLDSLLDEFRADAEMAKLMDEARAALALILEGKRNANSNDNY